MNLFDVDVYPLQHDEVRATARILAESMCTNPNHEAIFGKGSPRAIRKQMNMFEMVLRHPESKTYVAKIDNKIIGSMSYLPSTSCQASKGEIFKSMPKYLKMFGRTIIPVLKWRMNWARHDHSRPHLHFGPLAVDVQYQGRGVGKLLLKHFCQHLDQCAHHGYLETDKFENVLLYEQFGFEVIAKDKLFGLDNWFMLRS